MSSDAHTSSLVGKEGVDRPVTRLRLGQPTFIGVRNALLNNPKARCRVEALLPASYPRLLTADFKGGFLDGVTLEFSANLNCLIGGRGSGKSTALIAIRAALGAQMTATSDNPDDPVRMPDRTTISFLDAAGTERLAIRDRGDIPRGADGSPIELQLADLGQGESGDVANSYLSQPLQMLEYLDGFCDLNDQLDAEQEVLDLLTDNAAEIVRTSFRQADLKAADDERQKLEASIKAAEKGALEDIAVWALRLATQNALVSQLKAQLDRVSASRSSGTLRTVAELAAEARADLTQPPMKKYAADLQKAQVALGTSLKAADTAHQTSVKAASALLLKVLGQWDAEYLLWETKRRARQVELEAQGLKVQAGALTEMGKRFEALTKRLSDLQEKQRQHIAARAEREILLESLRESRRLIFERRKRTLKRVTKRANDSTLGLEVSVSFTHEGIRKPWLDWLGPKYRFKGDRLSRLGTAIKPWEFAASVRAGDVKAIANLIDKSGDKQPFFSTADVDEIAGLSWDELFALDMMRIQDLARITVKDDQHGVPREFNQLSAGQQRSVLLSLLLCADRSDPLVIDQPEDHLDAPYIASGVVRHIEQAKERRQLILATHNANLTVLGDAELVIPLYAEAGQGTVVDSGAVDDPETLRHVCTLLEGGAGAYARRGRRYGFEFAVIPDLA